MTVVRMINSVDIHVAGEEADLDPETADRFILLGYAEGELSREFTDEERDELTGGSQEVSV
jgi:hypothetical protein